MQPLLLTRAQAAEALGVREAQVAALLARGEIALTDLGDGVPRIATAALEQFVLRHTPGVAAPARAAQAREPSVVLTQEDPMTHQTTSPPQTLPRGMQWRVQADGTRRIRVRVQVRGEFRSKTFGEDQYGAALAFQAEAKAGQTGRHAPEAMGEAAVASEPGPEADGTSAPRLRPPEGLSALSTLRAAFEVFLAEARAGRALTRDDAPYALSTLITYEEVAGLGLTPLWWTPPLGR